MTKNGALGIAKKVPLRNEVEKALDELIVDEAGFKFQSLAVVLAKQKWPRLIAAGFLMKATVAILVLVSMVALCALEQQPASAQFSPQPLDSRDYSQPNQFSFLGSLLENVEVVSLAESIHMTHEFPLVRLGIIRYLNENLGFHVLAMEGSAEDLWVAQDRLLNSVQGPEDVAQAEGGLFPLWNTPEIWQLFQYEAESWRTSHPLYITAYDIQPGSGRSSHGTRVFAQLATRLADYVAPPSDAKPELWIENLAPLVNACRNYHPSDHDRVADAISRLGLWTQLAAGQVEKRFPSLPHATALRLIPRNLQASLQLCDDLSLTGAIYKSRRDDNAAVYTLELKETLRGAKLMLWAHFSHLSYNSEHRATSTGEVLHRALGPRLYTIVPFAESGGAILIFPGNNDDVGYGRIHGDRGPVGERLSRLSPQSYFLNLRSVNDPVFAKPQPLWVESGLVSLVPAHDVDSIIWIKKVHAPDLRPTLLFLFSTLHYRAQLFWGAGVLVFVVVIGFGSLLSRRRKTKLKTAAARLPGTIGP